MPIPRWPKKDDHTGSVVVGITKIFYSITFIFTTAHSRRFCRVVVVMSTFRPLYTLAGIVATRRSKRHLYCDVSVVIYVSFIFLFFFISSSSSQSTGWDIVDGSGGVQQLRPTAAKYLLSFSIPGVCDFIFALLTFTGFSAFFADTL